MVPVSGLSLYHLLDLIFGGLGAILVSILVSREHSSRLFFGAVFRAASWGLLGITLAPLGGTQYQYGPKMEPKRAQIQTKSGGFLEPKWIPRSIPLKKEQRTNNYTNFSLFLVDPAGKFINFCDHISVVPLVRTIQTQLQGHAGRINFVPSLEISFRTCSEES